MIAQLEQQQTIEPWEPSTILDRNDWPPNYPGVFAWRQQKLMEFASNPQLLAGAKEFYKTHPIEFINHWTNTFDPRNAGDPNKLTTMPFVLFKRQAEMVQFLYECLIEQENGLVEKSREQGATWIGAAFSVWMLLFFSGAVVGWGSRKEQLVDRLGDPSSIFEKIRMIIRSLPQCFVPNCLNKDTMTYMRVVNSDNGSSIIGESGDSIGRGGRALIYLVDEAAHIERPELIEASLSATTRCRIDVSSVAAIGSGGYVFSNKREAGTEWYPNRRYPKGKTRVFVFDWSQHPEKSQEWYDTKKKKYEAEGLFHVFAQEIARDASAAIVGVIIPGDWVRAAIDAHLKLGFGDDGGWCAALDVADGGNDTNALVLRKGVIVKSIENWGARDVGITTRKAIGACEDCAPVELYYDCIGIGAAVKAESNRLKDENLLPDGIRLLPWNAGAAVKDPEKYVVPGDRKSPKNEDFYLNLRSQGWWQLRGRFERTYRAINDPNYTWDEDDLISLPSSLPLLLQAVKELSQPTIEKNSRMKLMIEKAPDGSRSPNIGDAIMMAFHPVGRPPMVIPPSVLQASRIRGYRP